MNAVGGRQRLKNGVPFLSQSDLLCEPEGGDNTRTRLFAFFLLVVGPRTRVNFLY